MKNIFKHITFSAILLMLAGGFSSCNDKKEEPFLTVDETYTIESAASGTYSIVVNSNSTWTATVENADWCTLDKSTGKGDAVITVTVAENTLYTPRSTTVTITSEGLEELITILQHAATGEDGYPIEVPFIEYSLQGTNCKWERYMGNINEHTDVIIINSQEELLNYIECTEMNYSEIDFSKYTLLLTYGRESVYVDHDYTSLQQISAQGYVMKVNRTRTPLSSITFWQVPIIVSKIDENSDIELIVTYNP